MSSAVVSPAKRETWFDILDTFQAIEDTIAGTSDPEAVTALQAKYEETALRLVEKVDDFVRFMNHDQAEKQFLLDERNAIEKKIDRINRREQNLRDYASYVIHSSGERTAHGRIHSMYLRKCADRLDITDPQQIPPEYTTVKTEHVPDRMAIKRAIQSGAEIPGARLIEGRDTVVIK